jgi:FAD/FMN-containing dehydrogenase
LSARQADGSYSPEIAAAESGRAYWGENYTRLCEIKSRYDPKNVFRNPQSVALPTAADISGEDNSGNAAQDAPV